MRVTIDFKTGTEFEIDARGHKITCDQPASNGGTDRGVTPPELLLSSLGSCAGYYAIEYLRARALPLKVRVDVSAEKAAQPARIGRIRLEIHTSPLEERHQTGLMRAVHACLVQNTLTHPPEIEYALFATSGEMSLVEQMH